jgi:hypothetical protein
LPPRGRRAGSRSRRRRGAQPAEEADAFLRAAFAFGPCQWGDDEFGKRAEIDALSGLHGLDGKRDGQMALACAGRAKEVDDLAAGDEAELGKGEDSITGRGALPKYRQATVLREKRSP